MPFPVDVVLLLFPTPFVDCAKPEVKVLASEKRTLNHNNMIFHHQHFDKTY